MIKRSFKSPGMFGFVLILLPAAIGGALWDASGLPLGWLMGAALVTGIYAMSGREVAVPKVPHRAALVIIGSGVGLVLTPEVAARMVVWAPAMIVASGLGIALAAVFAPVLVRLGRVDAVTAYFSLLPGGVIEMAKVGGEYGADRTTIAALHTLRVGLVVGVLPLLLLAFVPHEDVSALPGVAVAGWRDIAIVLAGGAFGGWVGSRIGLPAAWLLGAVVGVGMLAGTGVVEGRLHPLLITVAQILVGLALGARFERRRLASIPRAVAAGLPTLLGIMAVMALFAVLCALILPISAPTLILAVSIGGMAEMVLTAKALNQDIALVAAFQAVRAVVVNAFAGVFWQFLRRRVSNKIRRGG